MSRAKTALITGVTGQDGAYLSELLLAGRSRNTCVHLMQVYSDVRPLNVGSSEDISINGLAQLVAEIVGFPVGIRHDPNKPDGTPRKLLDSSRLRATGWRPRIGLRTGIAQVYAEYRQQVRP